MGIEEHVFTAVLFTLLFNIAWTLQDIKGLLEDVVNNERT